jgi:hypothetical protein
MMPFWNILYDNVLLEFMYVNNLSWPVPHMEVLRPPDGDKRGSRGPIESDSNGDIRCDNRILLPLGGTYVSKGCILYSSNLLG